MEKGLCAMFSYDLNSRYAAATRISVMGWDVALRQMLSVFNGGLRISFSIWKGCSIARGKLQPWEMGCPEEEHVGFFVCFPIAVHYGYFTPRGSPAKFSSWDSAGKCLLSYSSWWFKVRESKTTLVPEVIRIVRCSKKHVPSKKLTFQCGSPNAWASVWMACIPQCWYLHPVMPRLYEE